MKRKLLLILSIFLLTGVLFASPIREEAAAERSDLVILHTNDYHGSLLSNGGRGGAAEVASFVRAVKTIFPQVLLVDAGDINTGSAISNMFHAEPDILAYNIMGYDAVVFGNHEFDGSLEKLNRQIELAEFPFVSSNIKTEDGYFLGGNQYIIKQFDGFTVGIFGITTRRTQIVASPDSSLVFIDEIEAARDVVNILRNRENADIVIALTHLGVVKDSPDSITSIELAQAVHGIDIIVDGHSHTYMEVPIEQGRTRIVSANEWGKYVGFARITIFNGKITDFFWAPIPIGPDREVVQMLQPYIEKANADLKEVIGEAADTFIFGNRLPRYTETAVGNLITDANVWYLRTIANQNIDFAFHNGGNIRAELPKGPITREHILTILPFENYLFAASMTGAQIIELFDFIASIPQGAGGFPQFSADVRYTIDKTGGESVIRNLTIGGQPVDPARVYRFCTNDYLIAGGDGYEVLNNAFDNYNVSLLLSYVVTEYIRSLQEPVQPVLDGRLNVIGGVEITVP